MCCPKCGDPQYEGPTCRTCGHGMPVGTPTAEPATEGRFPPPLCTGIAPPAEPIGKKEEETGWTVLDGVENLHS